MFFSDPIESQVEVLR